jgi:RNA polymerase sigma-70 factor, ECF subfamily
MMSSRFVDGIVTKAETIHCVSDASCEEALVIAAKKGNERAFETLVKRYRGRIIAIALRFTRLEQDAEDAAQQGFQKAYFRLHTFEGKSSFSTWLTRIAINEALMLRRRTRAPRHISIDENSSEAETGSTPLEIPDSRPDPEASYAQRERARILLAAMDKLRPALRKAIELRELSGLSMEETAGLLGISAGAVKARLFHARRELREVLRPHLRPARRLRSKAMRETSIAHRGIA